MADDTTGNMSQVSNIPIPEKFDGGNGPKQGDLWPKISGYAGLNATELPRGLIINRMPNRYLCYCMRWVNALMIS
jgi:hypothetical protein